MAKRGYISRYLFILRKLTQKPYSTMQEIQDHLENKIEYLQSEDERLNIGISKRTIERDFKEMRKLFGCDIQYSKKYKGYFIEE